MADDGDQRISDTPRRGLPRHAVTLDGHLRDGAHMVPVRVADLSCDGCRVEGELVLEQATEIWLKVAGFTPRPARVAWSRDGQAGCEFVTPLDEATVKAVLQRAMAADHPIDRRRT
jgi:hypothetical protein